MAINTRIALKLTPAANQQQTAQADFVSTLVRQVMPEGSSIRSVIPLLSPEPAAAVAQKVSLAARLDPTYVPTDFSAWYQIEIQMTGLAIHQESSQSHVIPEETMQLLRDLRNLSTVESAHPLLACPPPVQETHNPRAKNEHFQDPAPIGIDTHYAWSFSGGDGSDANFVDMEQGWNLDHEDLVDHDISLISGTNREFVFHGTGVLGILVMVDNSIGGIGISPSAKARVISQFQPPGFNTAAAIVDAVLHMEFGDVLLLEAQIWDPISGSINWPVEIEDSTYAAVRLATALGITVVEAAGNGGHDLDSYIDWEGKRIFDRSNSDFRDSGAIMVGAATSIVPHRRLWFSNYGNRIDVYAWGENVDTATTDWAVDKTVPNSDDPNRAYTKRFGGTSSASAIITGTAVVLQSVANSNFGYKLPPKEARSTLRSGGTVSENPAFDKIGVMPDLRAMIKGAYINLASDIYVRHSVYDALNPTTRLVSMSPDIIVRQQSVSDPQATFGAGSGTENSLTLSQDVVAGRDHSIYVRMLNRGGSTATSTKATVYWSPPATLVTPDQWQLIGTVSTSSVPLGNILTVTNRLAWPAAVVPPTGHYCFVAAVRVADDPELALPTTFPDFVSFVEKNNNVAWRNFNVISAPPSTGTKDIHVFPFNIPGAFDAPRIFSIRGYGSLPPGSKVILRAPLTLVHSLGIVLQEYQIERHNDTVSLPLHAFGRTDLGEGMLQASSFAACELHVRVPVSTYTLNGKFEYALAQIWEGIEVGRLTYHFGPRASIGKSGGWWESIML